MGLAPMNPAFRRQVEAFLEAGMSRRRLARNFDIAESEVQRMLNPDHATMTATIDRALLKSGKLPNVERGPSRGNEEGTAILVADLGSSEFLSDIESFVDAVHRFKAALNQDDPAQLSDSEIRNKAAAAPATPKSLTTAVVVYARSPHVAELAKRRARGKCELCKQPAPFNNTSNKPYLESHHIVWLARGGADRPENTVALCPNCHRKMHVVNDAKDIRKLQRRAVTGAKGRAVRRRRAGG